MPGSRLNLKLTHHLNGYVFAILTVAVMLAVRWALTPVLASSAALLIFIFPVIVVSLFYGLRPGIIATLSGAIVADYFFIHPLYTLSITRQEDLIRVMIFIVEGISISALGEFHLRKKLKLHDVLRNYALADEKQKLADEKARRLENDLAKVWRLNTLGEMASGLAHELAQPISSIKNYSVALQKLLEADNKLNHEFVVESIKGIGTESDRATRFIQSLRSFIGSRTPEKKYEDINRMITELDILIKSDLNSNNIKINYVFAEPTLEINIDKIQIMQVILNLLRNAIESMNSDKAHDKIIIVETSKDEDGALITVNDTGCGIPKEETDKIYEPFFTTKKSGMGMGLAISRSMIEIHNGKIWNQPNNNMGTTFKVWLPIREGHA